MEPIGKVIKNKVEEQGRSIQWLAEKLSCHRSNVYDIFNRENIDVSLLIKISSILKYNFLKDVADSVDNELG
ncbi:MAG: helix-turn-helix transcriptional regulator [Bacteroidaceae bacterium]|nr:helix-turn-helix transcriptional regulator [Bacteroidaceae bacterium]